MCHPLKQISRTSTIAWSASPAAPTLMAMGASASSAGHIMGADSGGSGLDFVSCDLSKPGHDMDVVASVQPEGGRRFSSMSWGSLGVDTGAFPYGVVAGGLQDGIISLWNPHAIVNSQGRDQGVIHTSQVHKSAVNCIEFNPMKSSILATCGGDGEVNILSLANPAQPEVFKPSSTSKHAGTEVLCCAWNRKLQHILCSCSNTGTTVVWDLKMKKEVISFQDPASRQRCSAVAWNPEVPTQLLVAYDDDRNPSMQMWDLRNCQYPFKETAGHTKGILGVSWNPMDPNLLMSCGKDNKLLCWCLSSGSPEVFCEIPSQQGNMEVKWAPYKPSIIAAPSFNGVVSVYSMQQQQSHGVKYCPKWYSKPCGVSFGFGGKMLAFGTRLSMLGDAADKAHAQPQKSWCHSLVVPNEPEVVPAADRFEQWIAQRNLRDYCLGKTNQNRGGTPSVEELMWEMMGLQFDSEGRRQVPAILGFEADKIMAEAERFLGKKPGTTLTDQPPEQKPQETHTPAQPEVNLGPSLGIEEMESFFEGLSAANEQKQREEQEREQQKQIELAYGAQAAAVPEDSVKTNWSSGPESIIKHSLLTGNLTAAVECCFKSGRMAEALLLASGGGTALWTRARDEYLRLQDDTFLTTVGNIMTNDFEKLVMTSDLSNWKETLAILATYSAADYSTLCEQLAERLEKEKFDIRSAVICYICAANFPKTVNIWANTHIASKGSQKLALQELVEKMAVLQEATRFQQVDSIFSGKITQYAEILANSGRLTAAMRYLCLLQNDASSAILRDRIYNSAPQQMSSLFGRPPPFPFQVADVRVAYQPPQQQTHSSPAPGHLGAQAGIAPPGQVGRGGPGPVGPGAQGGPRGPAPSTMMPPAPRMPSQPSPPGPGMMGPPGGMGGPPGGMGGPGGPPGGMGPGGMPPGGCGGPGPSGPPSQPTPPRPQPGPQMPPAPRLPTAANMPPGPPAGGMGMGPGGMGPGGGMGGGMGPPGGMGGPGPAGMGPPGGMGCPSSPAGLGGPPRPPTPGAVSSQPPPPQRPSTAPNYSAMPVIEGMPVAWPLPTSTQQKLSNTSSVAEQNQAVQRASAGAGAVQGEPLPQHELAQVKGVFGMLLESAQPNAKNDLSNRLEDLYNKLQCGHLRTEQSQKVVQMAKCVEAQDYQGASRIYTDLCSADWNLNKNWLMGVRRLLPTR